MKKCRYYTLFTTKNVNIQQKLQQYSQKLVKIISKNLIKRKISKSFPTNLLHLKNRHIRQMIRQFSPIP